MIHIVYHSPCMDGHAAAWVVRTWCIQECLEYQFHPSTHGDNPPDNIWVNDEVIIVDFSYPLSVLKDLESKCKKVLILDHHKTAMNDLSSFSSAIFDMSRSGCSIAWDHFFPNEEKPSFIKYIEDQDLWKFNLPYSRSINAYLGMDDTVTHFDDLLDEDLSSFVEKGNLVLAAEKKLEDSALERPIWVNGVPYFNIIPELVSKTCNRACSKYEVSYSLAFYMEGGITKYSIRGDGSVDVSAIARFFGGGGHFSASGFELPGYVNPANLDLNWDFITADSNHDVLCMSNPKDQIKQLMEEFDFPAFSLDMSEEQYNRFLVSDDEPITPAIACALNKILSFSVFFWLEQQMIYSKWLERKGKVIV